MSTTPTPPPDQAASTPGRAEELARNLEMEAYLMRGAGRFQADNITSESAALLRVQSATIDRLNQLVSERTEAANDFEQKAIALNAELLSIRHELDAANDWAKSQAMLLTQANAELLALRAALLQAGEEVEGWRKECDADRSRAGAEPAYAHNYFPKYIDAALNSPTQKP